MSDAGHQKVYLRPLTEEDITDTYVGWFADGDVTRFLDARNISRQDAIDHLRAGKAGRSWFLYAICIGDGMKHVGNLKIGPIHWQHRISDMVTVIGDTGAWGKGYAREAIRKGIAIAFNELKLRKLSASIDSLNAGSIKAYTGAGFEIETALKDQFMKEDADGIMLSDKVYVACFNDNFMAGKYK